MTDAIDRHPPQRAWKRFSGRLLGASILVLIATAAIIASRSGILVGPPFGGLDVAGLVRVVTPIIAEKPPLLVVGELVVAGAVRWLDGPAARSPGSRSAI